MGRLYILSDSRTLLKAATAIVALCSSTIGSTSDVKSNFLIGFSFWKSKGGGEEGGRREERCGEGRSEGRSEGRGGVRGGGERREGRGGGRGGREGRKE